MCACEAGYVCSRCAETPFHEAVERAESVTLSEWEAMVAGEQMQTAEPYEGRERAWT